MATVTGSESLAVADWDHGSESKSDRYLASRLAAASADYKGVAAMTFALAAAVAAGAWLVLGVLAEHWLVPGGLPVAARWSWFGLGVTALAAAIVRWVVPLVRYRVNLVYAARVIEHDHPELHNDLVNAVLVKAHPDCAKPNVARMLERRAAKRLSGVPADGIADRGVALRLTFALASLVMACCIYEIVAPKSLLASAGRLVAPWWGLAAPSRVSIAEPRLAWRMPPDEAGGDRPAHPLRVVGGSVSLVRGRQLLVETEVSGLRSDERPMLEATPLRDDGMVDAGASWRQPLTAAGRSGRMTVVVPDATRGLQHGVEFVVTAGDARSDRLRVAVVDTPTLLVREVRYEYPPYTGRPAETVAWQGDLRAPEFTKVTITAECNRPLAAAWIDPGCAGRASDRKRMRIGQHDLSRAIGEFPLRMQADRSGPEFASYRLVFQPQSAAGAAETDVVEKLEHRVEVIPDVPPEVTIEAPADAVRVPPSAPVSIRVRAVDPDYGLARAFVEVRIDQEAVKPSSNLLQRPHVGVFEGAIEIVPEKFGVAAGRKLEYRAVAEDTRPERPNRTESPWRTLQVDAAARPQPPERRPGAGQSAPGERRDDAGSRDGSAPGDRRDAGEPQAARDSGQAGEQQAGEQGDQRGGQESGQQAGEQAGERAGEQGGQQGGGKKGGQRDGQQGGQQDGKQGGKQGGGSPRAGDAADAGAGGRQDAQAGSGSDGDSPSDAGGRRPAGPDPGAREQGGGRPRAGKADGRGEAPQPNAVAADGTNDGEAMERILENRSRQAAERRGGETAGDRGREQIDQGQGAEGRAEAQQPKSCQGADGKPCGKEGCASCGGGAASGGSSSGGSSSGGAGQADSGQPSRGGGKPGTGQSGEGQPGEGQPGAGQPGAGEQGDGKPGGGESGGSQPGSGQAGSGRPGAGRPDAGAAGGGQAAGGQRTDGTGDPGRSDADHAADGRSGTAAAGEGRPGADQVTGNQPGAGQSGEGREGRAGAGRPDADAADEGRPGAGGVDQGKPGQGTTAQDHAGDAGTGKHQPGAGEGADGTRGSGESGAGEPGAGRPGAGRPEAGQAGADKPGAGQPGASEQGGSASGASPEGSHVTAGGAVGGGGRVGGARGHAAPGAGAAPPARDVEWTQQDTAHARNAADLAVEHLRDSVDQGRTDVLDELGWTPQQARAFIERWQAMRRLAESDDPVQRGEFERAVRSLGLRPDGVRSARDVPADRKGGQAEGRRSRPPAAYREQVEAFLRGTGGG